MKKVLGLLFFGMLSSAICFSGETIIKCTPYLIADSSKCGIVIESTGGENYNVTLCSYNMQDGEMYIQHRVISPVDRKSETVGFCTTTIKFEDTAETLTFKVNSKNNIDDMFVDSTGFYACRFDKFSLRSLQFFEKSKCWSK